jgi:integrase
MARAGGRDRGVFFRAGARGMVIGPKGQRGAWCIEFYDGAGLRHRERAGTKSEARALYARRQTEVRQAKHFPENMRQAPGVTVRALCDRYLATVTGNRRKTAEVIGRRLREVVKHLPADAESVRRDDVEALKVRLVEGPRRRRSAASINRFLQDLRAVFSLAERTGDLARSPFHGVRLLRETNQRTRELTPAEEAALLLAIPPEPAALSAFYQIALETGSRAGELCGLTWRSIRWGDAVAEVRETKAGRVQFLTLSERALALLRGLPQKGESVFTWPDGRPFTVDYVSHAFRRAARQAGIPDVRLHDLRHAFAIRRLRAGVDLYTVSRLLRHQSVRMSERYLAVTREDLKAAVEVGNRHETATKTATGRRGGRGTR